jgi:uncharacterized damage-inducible protein DinB
MTKEHIRLLYEFDKWATNQQHSVISRLTAEQYGRNLGASYGSIHGTLVHLYGAQTIWLSRWNGVSPTQFPDAEETPNLEILMDRWSALREAQDRFLSGLTDEKLKQHLAFKTFKGDPSSLPLWQQMQHVVNHSSYHRGQITTMFRQLDVAPVGTDLITYYRSL